MDGWMEVRGGGRMDGKATAGTEEDDEDDDMERKEQQQQQQLSNVNAAHNTGT